VKMSLKGLNKVKKRLEKNCFGGTGTTVELAGKEFNLLPKGNKGYEYVMYNEDIRLFLAEKCLGGRILPEVFVALNASYLWGLGYDMAFNKLIKWIGSWAMVESERINRADMCVDLEVPLPDIDIRTELVTKAKTRVDYHQIEHYSSGMRDTGYRIGSGTVVGRIYDKRYEAIQSIKPWFIEVWKLGGYDGELPVTRVEGQFRRQFLKEMSVESYSDLIVRMPDIWRIFSTEFVTLRVPNTNDKNHRRWEVTNLWKTIQNATSKFGECRGIQRYKQSNLG